MSTVEKTAEWKINGHQVDIFEIETNYIARIYVAGSYYGMRVYKKSFLNRLRTVRKSLEKELSASMSL